MKHFSPLGVNKLSGGHHNLALRYDMDLDARNPDFGVCEQRRRRPACACAQSDQRLCYSLSG